MYTFIKLGGSVITDKRGEEAADLPVIRQLATELAAARQLRPEVRVILGHGSGSFGHVAATRYGVHRGRTAGVEPFGLAMTAGAALRLNRIVVDALLDAGLPAMAFQPSATLWAEGGQIASWATDHIEHALEEGLLPVIHGDVAFDHQQGTAIISTELLLAHLALTSNVVPNRIILVGEDAVYTTDPRRDPEATRIPVISADNLATVLHGASGSHGVDVTGGMRSKLELMWRLVTACPGLEVQLIGPTPGNLAAAVSGNPLESGTIIRAYAPR